MPDKMEFEMPKGAVLLVEQDRSAKGHWVTWLATFTDANGRTSQIPVVAHRSVTKKKIRKRIEKLVDVQLAMEAKHGILLEDTMADDEDDDTERGPNILQDA